MKILHTGRGTGGSWQCRGVQLGDARPKARAGMIAQADAVVLVKRPYAQFVGFVREAGKPWVWDVVDAYPQPECTRWGRSHAIHWFKQQLARLRPDGVIFPTARMQEDCATDIPSTVIYHHHRPGIKPNPVRERISVVGYEGDPKYLGRWRGPIEEECARRGWQFLVNPSHLASLDVVFAVRDPDYSGYAQYHWKSNVKLANAHGSGTPFIGQPECGYVETQLGGERFVDRPADIPAALDALTYSARRAVSNTFLGAGLTAEACAGQVRRFVESVA